MDISIQQPSGKAPGIWISGLTQDQKTQIKRYITTRTAYKDHPDHQKVTQCGPFFQIDYDDILFIELWIRNTCTDQEYDQWPKQLMNMLKEQFKDWII